MKDLKVGRVIACQDLVRPKAGVGIIDSRLVIYSWSSNICDTFGNMCHTLVQSNPSSVEFVLKLSVQLYEF
jgi:hypothetical protein